MSEPLSTLMNELCSKIEQDSPGAMHPIQRDTDKVELNPTPRPMFNPFQGKHYVRKHEKLEDRLVIMMKSAGYTNVEIAEQLGITPVAVSYITKQPWAADQVLEEIERLGRDKVVAVLQGAAYDAAKRLIEISETAENMEVKRKANNDVLDRVLGKPNQPVTHHQGINLEELSDAELANIAAAKKN